MEDMESLLIPQISMDVDDTPLNLEESQGNADETSDTTDNDTEESIQIRLRNLLDLENFDPAQTPEKLNEMEMEAKERLFSDGHPPIEYVRMHCSSCNCHLGTAPLNQDNRYIHPLLNVLVCKNCYEFYCSGDFEKDEDGSELYCRWCGQGGKVMCCSGCAYVFCQRCVRQNLGKRTLDLIIESDDWYCFACNPSQLINLRILCATLFDYVKQEISEVKQSQDLDRLKRDFSMCCNNKSPQQKYAMPMRKRRRAASPDETYHPSTDKALVESNNMRRQNHLLKKALMHSNNAAAVGGGVGVKPLPPLQKHVLNTANPPPLAAINVGAGASGSNTVMQVGPRPNLNRSYPMIQPRPQFSGIRGQPNFIRPQMSMVRPQLAPGVRPIVLSASTNRPITSNNMTAQRGTQNFIPANNIGGAPGTPNAIRVIPPPQSRRVSSLPANFQAGTRNNWFNQAATITSTIVAKLSTNLVQLSDEQSSATSVEQLATVHNKLQELLSSSVNSLIQVRKNLRNEFLNDLNKMRFTAIPKQGNRNIRPNVPQGPNAARGSSSAPVVIDDDDDVIIVNNEEEDPLSIQPSSTVETKKPEQSSNTPATAATPGGFLKVKSFIDLNKASKECISVPEEEKKKLLTNGSAEAIDKDDEDTMDASSDIEEVIIKNDEDDVAEEESTPAEEEDETISVKEESTPADEEELTPVDAVEKQPTPPPVEKPVAAVEKKAETDLDGVDKETYLQIQHALAESKLEALIEENSKYKVDTAEICPEELGKILTVRVMLTNNFSSINLARQVDTPEDVKQDVDIEELLHGNVINTEPQPQFENAFSNFVQRNKTTTDEPGEVEDEEEENENEIDKDLKENGDTHEDEDPLAQANSNVEMDQDDNNENEDSEMNTTIEEPQVADTSVDEDVDAKETNCDTEDVSMNKENSSGEESDTAEVPNTETNTS